MTRRPFAIALALAASAAGQQRPPRIWRSPEIQEGRLIRRVRPVYPPIARQARIEGAVEMAVVIGGDGTVRSIRLIIGHPFLVVAAMAAVKQWRYLPATIDGEPLEVFTRVTIHFTLRGPDGLPERDDRPRGRAVV